MRLRIVVWSILVLVGWSVPGSSLASDAPGSGAFVMRANYQAIYQHRSVGAYSYSASPAATPALGEQGGKVHVRIALDFSFPDITHGWILGSSCANTTRCPIVIERSGDGGITWRPVASPIRYDSPLHSVSHITFADDRDGWSWGPDLYATHDGALHWQRVALPGQVEALAVADGIAWAAVQNCGSAPQCPVTLYSTAAGGTAWKRLSRQPGLIAHPPPAGIGLVRRGKGAWLLSQILPFQAGTVTAAVRYTADNGRRWQSLPNPCATSNTETGFSAHLDVLDAHHQWMLCTGQPSAGSQPKVLYTSTDGGHTWRYVTGMNVKRNVALPEAGYVSDLVFSTPLRGWLALDRYPLVASTDGGSNWHPAPSFVGVDPGDEFEGPIEFLDAMHGWVLFWRHQLFLTSDGGNTWRDVILP